MTSPVVTPTAPAPVAPAERLERLALVGAGGPDQPLAELEDVAVTIGAGPRCTIRLTDAGLRPLLCVVTPTEAGPRVRRWAAGVLLNGEAFDEATLVAGDRLILGEVELSVVDLAETSPAESDPIEEAPHDPPASDPVPEAPTDNASAADIDLADLAGHEWALPSDFESEPLGLADGIAQSVQAWNEALPSDGITKKFVELPESSAFQEEFDGLRNQLVETLASAQQLAARVELLDERQKSNRGRVARLVDALRQQSGEAELLRTALERREEESLALQQRLEEALSLGDAVQTEIDELHARHAQDLQSQADRLEAEYAAKLTEAESVAAAADPEPVEPQEAEAADETTWSIAEMSEPHPIEPQSIGAVETIDSLWQDAAEAVQTESPAEPHEEAPAAAAPAVAEESPWGIEQLASSGIEPAEEDPGTPIEETVSEATTPEAPTIEAPTLIQTDWFSAEEEPATEEERVEPSSEGASHDEPQSFIEKYGHLLPEEDDEVEPIAAVDPPPEPAVESAADDVSVDDSIDDYMQRLMQRVRGDAGNEHEGVAVADAQPAPVQVTVAAAPESQATSEPIKCLSELSRSEAPEASADMDALRQLANYSARSAIQVASKNEGRANATLNLASSVIGIVFGAVASMTAASPYGIQFIGGLIAVIGCGWYGVKMLGFFQAVNAAEELGEEH